MPRWLGKVDRHRLQEIRRRPRLHADRAERRPDQLKIEPEVSQLDQQPSGASHGISVPPLIVRRASTTVELRDGQSFVIGGLLQSKGKNAQQQLPWLGDVPVLGALFRSASYQKNETDLAIIVTPRLVRPARPGDVIKTPLDGSLPANDVDLFLMGKTEVSPAKARPRSPAFRPVDFAGPACSICRRGGAMSSRARTDRERDRRARGSAGGCRTLGGCSDIYFDRRETIALGRRRCDGGQPGHADDRSVVAGKRQRNIAFNGEKACRPRSNAIAHGRVIPPVNPHHELGSAYPGATAGAPCTTAATRFARPPGGAAIKWPAA